MSQKKMIMVTPAVLFKPGQVVEYDDLDLVCTNLITEVPATIGFKTKQIKLIYAKSYGPKLTLKNMKFKNSIEIYGKASSGDGQTPT